MCTGMRWARRIQVKIGLTVATPSWLGCAFATLMARATPLTLPCNQALAEADEAVKVAAAVNQPVPLCITVLASLLVSLQTRDWHKVEDLIQRVSECATKHNLFPFAKVARGWRGDFAVSRGDFLGGIDLLQTALADLHEDGYELYRPQLSAALAEDLAKAGKRGPAYSTICEAIEWAHSRGRAVELPDLLHVKGEILLMSPADTIEGEKQLLESLQMSQLTVERYPNTAVFIFLSNDFSNRSFRVKLDSVIQRDARNLAHDCEDFGLSVSER
jgi:hypothetical protein